jgi:hypothetical protein
MDHTKEIQQQSTDDLSKVELKEKGFENHL